MPGIDWANRDSFTETEEVILGVLSDGLPHRVTEVQEVLIEQRYGVAARKENLQNIISAMRKILRRRGMDIIHEVYQRRGYYRHVRLLVPSWDGKRG